MNIEQRLLDAFRFADDVEASPDLFSRIVHSIDEDRRHRRRLIGTVGAIVAALVLVSVVGLLALSDGPFGRHVDRRVMEALELVVLATLVAVLGPAIRRFGRGYAQDLWPANRSTPTALLRLLDIAYYLVFTGYILLSTEFDFRDLDPDNTLASQLSDATARIGGLLLVMGLLHAVTIIVLPFIALVDNSTRAHRALPRWVVVLGVLAAVGFGLFMIPNLIGLILSAG